MTTAAQSYLLSPSEAAARLLMLDEARESLTSFVRAVQVPGKPVTDNPDEEYFLPVESAVAPHHLLLLRALERTCSKPSGRLMVFMPPGSAKSTYASVVFPAWWLGAGPGRQIILASYASDLARKQGKRTRQIVGSKRYRQIFETGLSAESSAADEFALSNGSEYMAGGLLSGLTGNRAGGVIIDDPVAGREEAESETIRRKTVEAYQDDLLSRLKPGGWVVLIQTRWHEDDLAGSILPDGWHGMSGPVLCRDGLTWEVLRLPAQADQADDPLGRKVGEYLWPEWFPETHWDVPKRNGRTWASLYQQLPAPEEGTYFKREWFRRYMQAPPELNVYITGDFAISEESTADYTEIAVWGMDSQRNVYALDWWTGQKSPADWCAALISLTQRWKPQWFIGERANIEKTVMPFLHQMMRASNVWVATEFVSAAGNKEAKARSFQGMQQVGQIYWPHTDWAERAIDQMLRFPAAKHDDVVDACSVFGRYLATVFEAAPPPPKPSTLADEWNRVPTFGELMR